MFRGGWWDRAGLVLAGRVCKPRPPYARFRSGFLGAARVFAGQVGDSRFRPMMLGVMRSTDESALGGEPASDAVLRGLVLAVFLLGALGTAGDLALIGHYGDAWQIAPFALLAVAVGAAVWRFLGAARPAVRAFQGATLLLVGAGLVGLWLHYQANVEFEKEMYASLSGFELFWKAIRGASPPSLAPASLIHLGLVGLAYTYRHPALRSRAQPPSRVEGDEQ